MQNERWVSIWTLNEKWSLLVTDHIVLFRQRICTLFVADRRALPCLVSFVYLSRNELWNHICARPNLLLMVCRSVQPFYPDNQFEYFRWLSCRSSFRHASSQTHFGQSASLSTETWNGGGWSRCLSFFNFALTILCSDICAIIIWYKLLYGS